MKILIKLLRERGLLNSVKYIYSRYRFLLKYQIPLAKIISPAQLNIKHPYANSYEPVSHFSFYRMLKKLNRNWKENTFVDFGCGKGAAIILADKYKFKKYIGVELAPSLAETARYNIAKVDKKLAERTHIVEADAAAYNIPTDADVFYFFNPFQRPVLAAVIQQMHQSLLENPRPIFVLYFNAVDLDLFIDKGFKICYAQKKDKITGYPFGNYALTN